MKHSIVQGWLSGCARLTHLLRFGKPSSPSASELALFAMGADVDSLALETVLADFHTVEHQGNPAADSEYTSRLIASGISALNQATFEYVENQFIRVDSIEINNGWLAEVKAGSKIKTAYIADLALQSILLSRAGFDITSFSLILRESTYVTGDPWSQALRMVDVTENVKSLLSDEAFVNYVTMCLGMTIEGNLPDRAFSKSCKACQFSADCWDHLENPAFNLPRISEKAMDAIVASESFETADVSEDLLTLAQRTYRFNAANNVVSISKEKLQQDLDRLRYPVAHLDFEAFNLPFHPALGLKAGEMVPFQSSIHVENADGTSTHYEFLCDHRFDDRYALAAHLVETLADVGSILTWNVSFERRMLRHLAEHFPEFAEALESIILKLVDLLPIVKNNIQHFAFRGSHSLKAVAPVLSEELSYTGLEISDGNEASGTFALMFRGMIPHIEIPQKRMQLLDYCRNDTAATLAILAALRMVGEE